MFTTSILLPCHSKTYLTTTKSKQLEPSANWEKTYLPDGLSPLEIWRNPACNKPARINLLSSPRIIGIAFFYAGQISTLNDLELTNYDDNGNPTTITGSLLDNIFPATPTSIKLNDIISNYVYNTTLPSDSTSSN